MEKGKEKLVSGGYLVFRLSSGKVIKNEQPDSQERLSEGPTPRTWPEATGRGRELDPPLCRREPDVS